jgi:hypothetical protein
MFVIRIKLIFFVVVTLYFTILISRGSLYRLLQKPGARENLDVKRCLNMAFDVVFLLPL